MMLNTSNNMGGMMTPWQSGRMGWDDAPLIPSSSMNVSANPFLNADFLETDSHFKIHCDLPGVKKDDLAIEIDDSNLLTLSAERNKESSNDTDTWHRRERSYGKFSRSIQLPNLVDKKHIDCKFTGGSLYLEFKKLGEDSANFKRITIK